MKIEQNIFVFIECLFLSFFIVRITTEIIIVIIEIIKSRRHK